MTKQKEFVIKWLPMLERVQMDDSLIAHCKSYDAYSPSVDCDKTVEELKFHSFLEEAYDSGIVVSNYNEFTDGKEELVSSSTDAFINGLSENEIMSCIAWHFRRDHWIEGSLINESFVDGSLLRLFRAFTKEK